MVFFRKEKEFWRRWEQEHFGWRNLNRETKGKRDARSKKDVDWLIGIEESGRAAEQKQTGKRSQEHVSYERTIRTRVVLLLATLRHQHAPIEYALHAGQDELQLRYSVRLHYTLHITIYYLLSTIYYLAIICYIQIIKTRASRASGSQRSPGRWHSRTEQQRVEGDPYKL